MSKIKVYTTAPECYDWGWTHVLIENYAYTLPRHVPVRVVEIEDEYHAKMQLNRYWSGLHGSWDEADWQKEVEKGFAVLSPNPLYCHRTLLDFEPYEEDIHSGKFDYQNFSDTKVELMERFPRLSLEPIRGGLGLMAEFFGDKAVFEQILREIWDSTKLERAEVTNGSEGQT